MYFNGLSWGEINYVNCPVTIITPKGYSYAYIVSHLDGKIIGTAKYLTVPSTQAPRTITRKPIKFP